MASVAVLRGFGDSGSIADSGLYLAVLVGLLRLSWMARDVGELVTIYRSLHPSVDAGVVERVARVLVELGVLEGKNE
ncbi:hypothetical protein [Hyperthermus butylicus]|uniref:hypothetical protein n=1 Tax=Hyperthermus butylicus TaxID=54248 RepID=UPI0003264012|nr:hypothetical protein [Hyperthermus butylicus]